MGSPSKGFPVFSAYGSHSPPKGPHLSLGRNSPAFFAVPAKGHTHKRPPGSRVLRLLTAACLASLLVVLLYMQSACSIRCIILAAGRDLQAYYSQAQMKLARADGAVDKMDRGSHHAASNAAAVAAAKAAAKAAAVDATVDLLKGTAPAVAPTVAPAGGYPAPHLQHLVLVAGHAVYTGVDYQLATKEASWFLEPYQQIPGQAQTFLDHIKLGIETAAKDPNALLLFSGGQTRQAAGPRSEGLSYWMVAEAAGWYGHKEVRSRAFTEEHARDSFENVLFSLCRFFELTGHYPAKITAVSYTLKQARFEQLHRAAVRYPADQFEFLGTPVPPAATGAQAGEAATVAAFQKDPYGCSGTLLAKKARRDPFAVGPPHPSRCPGMAELLKFCSYKQYTGPVPWDMQGVSGSKQKAAGLLPAGRRSSRSGIYT